MGNISGSGKKHLSNMKKNNKNPHGQRFVREDDFIGKTSVSLSLGELLPHKMQAKFKNYEQKTEKHTCK